MSPTEASSDRLRKLGALGLLREKRKQVVYRTQGILGSLCDATFLVDRSNPFVIDGHKVMSYARELYDALAEGGKIDRQIVELEAELGEV